MLRLFLTLPILLTACLKDETVSGYVDQNAVFQLIELDASPYATHATITFPAPGLVRGEGPCNTYAAEQSAPYPWFSISPIRATMRACPELALEAEFFRTLQSMTVIETLGTLIILRNDDGREMLFQSTGP